MECQRTGLKDKGEGILLSRRWSIYLERMGLVEIEKKNLQGAKGRKLVEFRSKDLI